MTSSTTGATGVCGLDFPMRPGYNPTAADFAAADDRIAKALAGIMLSVDTLTTQRDAWKTIAETWQAAAKASKEAADTWEGLYKSTLKKAAP